MEYCYFEIYNGVVYGLFVEDFKSTEPVHASFIIVHQNELASTVV